MAWTFNSGKDENYMGIYSEDYLLPNATLAYSTVITFLESQARQPGFMVTFSFKVDVLTGTNVDLALYGSITETGTKELLADAIVADLTDTTEKIGHLDIGLYPMPFYFLGWTTDADETSNTITAKIIRPRNV